MKKRTTEYASRSPLIYSKHSATVHCKCEQVDDWFRKKNNNEVTRVDAWSRQKAKRNDETGRNEKRTMKQEEREMMKHNNQPPRQG